MKTAAANRREDDDDDKRQDSRDSDGNTENRKHESDEEGEEDSAERAEVEEEEKRRRPTGFCVGARVERELDGLWFPGTVVEAEPEHDAFEIEYDEDLNREADVSASELRYLDPSRIRSMSAKRELTVQQQELLRKDSLLMQAPDYDPNKPPTVVLHHKGETHAGTSLGI
ncbi:hypothetical protein BBJ28_00003648 [Nothophytophthora sp. Chile5]|nr:hypothetical protein BBJ28_00003648 [Nothophytophthora sp. Chile5]